MSKKLIWTVVAIVLVLVVGGAAAIGGIFLYRSYEDQQNLAQAEEFFAEGDWGPAANYYRAYLSRNREDVAILRKYAETNEKMLSNRMGALRAAANAYYQLNSFAPSTELQDTIVDLYKQMRAWSDVEYYAALFLRDRPDDPKLLFDEAVAIASQGRAEDAQKAYQKLIDNGTTDPEVYAKLAGVLHQQGYEEQAKQTLSTLEKALPDQAETHLVIADYHLESGDIETAQLQVDKARNIAPDSAEMFMLQCRIELAKSDMDKALEAANSAIANGPDNVRAHLLLAVVQNRRRDHEGAVATLQSLSPVTAVDNPETLLALAESQISANRLADVDDTISRYREAYPAMRTMVDYLEGRKALAGGNAALAVTKLTNVVEMNPAFSTAQFYLAVSLLQSQQRERGRAVLESYLNNNPKDEAAKQLFQSEFGTPTGVADAKDTARDQLANSNSPDDLYAVVRSLLTQPEANDADSETAKLIIQTLRRIVEIDPTYEPAQQSLIFYLAGHGQVDAARAALDGARSAGIADDHLSMAKAAVNLADGKLEPAKSEFATALGRQGFTVDKASAWANLFATHNHIDEGLAVLTQAAEANIGDAAAIIDLEKPVLLARHDQMDRALATLQELSVKYGQSAEAKQPLLDLKLQFAQTLLNPTMTDERKNQGRQLLNQISEEDPTNADVMIVRAQDHLQQTPPDYDNAIPILEKALAVDKNNVNALQFLAHIYKDLGDDDRALEYARRAADVSMGNVENQLLVAQLQYDMQRHRECQSTLESLLATRPDSMGALEMLAQSYLASGRTQLAQTVVDRMRNAAGTDKAALGRVDALEGRLLVEEGRNLGKAESLLAAQAKAQPDNVVIASDLARAIAGQGRFDEAVSQLRQFTESHANNPESWYALGQFYLDQNDNRWIPQATSALTRALLLEPNYAAALRGQIDAQSRQNKPVETLQLADRYLQVRPNDDVVLYIKADLLRQLNRLDAARKSIDQAVDLNERSAYLFLRASIALQQKRYGDALTDLQKVAPASVPPANLDMALAEAYLGVGEKELALEHYESAKRENESVKVIPQERMRRFEEQIQESPSA